MPKTDSKFSVPQEAQPGIESLKALHGEVLTLTNRDAIDPEGWNRVADGLPPCPTVKPALLCWDVYDPAGRVRVTHTHPGGWNQRYNYIMGGVKCSELEVITHWRDRPKPPE